MRAYTTNGKAVDVFLAAEPGTPIIYLNTFSGEGQKYMRPRRLPTVRRSRWWPSVIWTGTTTWYLGTVRLLSKMLSLAPVVRTTICGF